MGKLRILLTTVGGLTSPDIIRALQDSGEREITVIGVDPFDQAVGRYFVDEFDTVPSSTTDPQGFVDAIIDLVGKRNIDLVIPCGNEDNLALAEAHSQIPCPVMTAAHADLLRAYDKGEVYQALQTGVPEIAPDFVMVRDYPSFLAAIEKLGYPERRVVVKPRHGRGGRGVYILNGALDYRATFEQKPGAEYPLEFFTSVLGSQPCFDELIVMEYLDSPFYSLYSLCHEDETLVTLTHTRDWGNASQTFRGSVYHDLDFQHIAQQVHRMFRCQYTTNMELATTPDGRVVLFDLNPRIGASSGIDRSIGVNFPYLAVKLLLGEAVSIDPFDPAGTQQFIRYFDNVWTHA